jgi:hypothetical protein
MIVMILFEFMAVLMIFSNFTGDHSGSSVRISLKKLYMLIYFTKSVYLLHKFKQHPNITDYFYNILSDLIQNYRTIVLWA